MSVTPQLTVSDNQGQRSVQVNKAVFTIGRRTTADLQVVSRDVSREHASITLEDGRYVIRDCGSRFGTFVNGDAITDRRVLVHGDRIRLGQTDAVDLVFLCEENTLSGFGDTAADISDLRHMTAILNGLRAVGSGRVLDEVLTLVIDSALEVTSADRGFIMLASKTGDLEFRAGRGRGRLAMAGASFETSLKIPREVFHSGESRIVGDLMEGDTANAHVGTIAIGIRHVLCVPLRITQFAQAPADRPEGRVIGVLYLDGRERGTLLSKATLFSLEAFATQAALAIDSARLYAEAAERAKLERDWRMAAEIQQVLLPEPRWSGTTCDLAGTSVPCRTIGGDFFDYLDLPDGEFGFSLGDVAGKGPPAALLATAVQSNFVAQAPVASDPADLMARLNRALLRRPVEARFATMFYGALSPDGLLRYSNAGQEPPVVVRAGGVVQALEVGGPVLGLLGMAAYEFGAASLAPGDIVVVCSDGITEARNAAGDEYGRDRMNELLAREHGRDPEAVLHRLMDSVNAFAGTEPQADDITALVLRYAGQQGRVGSA